MEVFTPPPYRESRPSGRPSKHTFETRLMIGRKVVSKEMTFREAAQAFGISQGAVASCARLYKNQGALKKRNERTQQRNTEISDYQHQAQLKELKQQIAELFLENQMLKKILNKSLQVKKYAGSVITTENLDQLQKDAE